MQDMNHRAKSVVWHVVQRNKNRASYFFRQPLDRVEILLKRQSDISQNVEAAKFEQHCREKILLWSSKFDVDTVGDKLSKNKLFLPVFIHNGEKSLQALQAGFVNRGVTYIHRIVRETWCEHK